MLFAMFVEVEDAEVDVNKPDVDKVVMAREALNLNLADVVVVVRKSLLRPPDFSFVDFDFGKKITSKTYFSSNKLNTVTTPYDPTLFPIGTHLLN